MNTPITFSDDLLDRTVSGVAYLSECNKKFKPEFHRQNEFDTTIHDGDVWFVKTDFIFEFFQCAQSFPGSITVVTQHCDRSADNSIFENRPKCVSRMFGPHNTATYKRYVPIPVGLGPPYPCGHGAPLADDIKKKNTKAPRDHLLYANFRPYTYPSERQPLWDRFSTIKESWVTTQDPSADQQTFGPYLQALCDHKFCLCPRGNGIESHRMWECLYSRTVPIVRYEHAHRNWTELPILFVNSWEEVTEDFLKRKYDEMLGKTYDYSKLDVKWWGKQFRE